MTQPPLSAAIAQLERQLGVLLLERTNKGVKPTEAGIYLAEVAQDVTRTLAEAERHLKGMASGSEGHLTLATIPAYSWQGLSGVLSEFSVRAPKVEIEIMDLPPRQVLDMVLKHRADVGIVSTSDPRRVSETYGNLLHVTEIDSLRLRVVMPRRLAHLSDPVDLEDLLEETWISTPGVAGLPGLPFLLERVWAEMGPPKDRRTVSTMQAAFPLIAAGLGIGIAPESLVAGLPPSIFVTRTSQQALPDLKTTLLWSRQKSTTSAMETFFGIAMPRTDASADNNNCLS